jgi:hypothetical protein
MIDHSKVVDLGINEITILMALASVGIVTVISLFLYVSFRAFLGKSI